MLNKWLNTIQQGDCLELMKQLPDKCIDMILCDLPYGITQNHWDAVIDLKKLWEQYERISKEDTPTVLTASQPFTSQLVMSNPRMFKYELIWEKTMATDFLNSKTRPLKSHENILIFYRKIPTYHAIKTPGKPWRKGRCSKNPSSWGNQKKHYEENINGDRCPRSVIKIANSNSKSLHPTQKPLSLFCYLIQTYSEKDDVILDNCMGSGTTARACKNLGRNFIGFEISAKYCEIANRRLQQEIMF